MAGLRRRGQRDDAPRSRELAAPAAQTAGALGLPGLERRAQETASAAPPNGGRAS